MFVNFGNVGKLDQLDLCCDECPERYGNANNFFVVERDSIKFDIREDYNIEYKNIRKNVKRK